MSPAPFARFPAIWGDRLVFVADDDLWIGTLAGEGATVVASRLTPGGLVVSFPRFSPDGAQVAFTGRRDGASEIYLVAAVGGEVRRLTYWGDATTRTLGWRGEGAAGRVLVASAAGEPSSARTTARAVSADGREVERLELGPVSGLAYGEGDLPVVIGVNQSLRRGAAWKRYRGGTAGALWFDPEGTGEYRRLLDALGGQLEDPCILGERVAFLSDHEGIANVYSVAWDGSDLRRHSDHDEYYARAMSGDGERLVYQHAGDLYLLDSLAPDSEPRRIALSLSGATRGRERRALRAEEELGDFAVDETGRASVVELRGSIQLLTHRDGPTRLLGGGDGVRGRLPCVIGRGPSAHAAFVSDAEGEDAIEIVPCQLSGEAPRRLGAGRLGRVLSLSGSPDGGSLAVAAHDGRILLVEVATGIVRELDRSADGDATGLCFSPDSRLLAWSHAGPEPLRQIRVARLSDGAVFEATPLRFEDRDPVFSADGRFLAFLSVRVFDPFYDAHVFDLAFASATRPYLLALGTDAASPFAPELAGRPRRTETGQGEAEPGDGDAAPAVRAFEPEGLADRLIPLPVAAGRYRALRRVEGGLVWLAEPLSGVLGEERPPSAHPARPWLVRFDLKSAKETTIVDELDDFSVSADGRSLVVRDGKALRLLPSDRHVEADPDEAGEEVVDIDLSRLRYELDPIAEWRQMYAETARLMRDHYFVEDMAGVDWARAVARYRPLVERIASRDELSELIWELQGELATSHAYEVAPPVPPAPERRIGHLGADISWRGQRLVVDAVLPSESSVQAARSPLRSAVPPVVAGDVIVAVDGRELQPGEPIGRRLAGTVDRPVALRVRRGGEGPLDEVVVVPLADERPLRYQAWVASRRAAAHRASDGRVGYVHVPDMVGSGWAQFHRDLRLEVRRDALVVDVRDNRGGHVSELVVEKLARVVRAWELGRYRAEATYPKDAPRGPLVAIADENAGSDGDIVTAAFKLHRLGPVVGQRTWGGVIGIDFAYDLVDGTAVTQPRYGFFFVGALGWDVENHGVEPDVAVAFSPQDWAAGRDPQLERAVELALEALADHEVVTPPDLSTRPSRVAPLLGPRPA
ncbi:MAG: S41 family peptidase [Actinomycetota bacterium]|nr:S41 family peptidase [Actinomycetota bacterium]